MSGLAFICCHFFSLSLCALKDIIILVNSSVLSVRLGPLNANLGAHQKDFRGSGHFVNEDLPLPSHGTFHYSSLINAISPLRINDDPLFLLR